MKKWSGNNNNDVGGSMNPRYFMFRKVHLAVTPFVVILFVAANMATVSIMRKLNVSSQSEQPRTSLLVQKVQHHDEEIRL